MGALCHGSLIFVGYLYLGGRFIVKNRHQKDDMCYDEIELCAHNYFDNRSRFNCHHNWDGLCDH